ncbi:hypothetical protein XELAEV_18034990mg [Xenopus laevis]|uniref:GIY-YIG domain-containing protein n=1 Tax=Xenopus laevis TaxID=8355 RepID=A0A974CF29_XENLA|nr:hypothetical protein XELAEV_18034990mg [Xenopus laevis]
MWQLSDLPLCLYSNYNHRTNGHSRIHFINCKTVEAIYIMKCQCGKEYVGKTQREFWRRILEHVGDVRHKRNTSVANHINELHNGNMKVMKFTAVEHIKSTTRIGGIAKKLLQSEAKWIYWQNNKSPNGLMKGSCPIPVCEQKDTKEL